jgi:hypothetical protein
LNIASRAQAKVGTRETPLESTIATSNASLIEPGSVVSNVSWQRPHSVQVDLVDRQQGVQRRDHPVGADVQVVAGILPGGNEQQTRFEILEQAAAGLTGLAMPACGTSGAGEHGVLQPARKAHHNDRRPRR